MRRWGRIAPLLAATVLAGCQSYSRDPLRSPADALAMPDAAALSTDAAKIDRPYLTPQPIDLSQPLTPNALAIIAVIENPDLKALRARNGVDDAQAFAARLLPDPSIQAGVDKLLSGADEFNGFAGQIGVDLMQIRDARVIRQAGEAKKQQVRLDLAWAEWQTAGQARLLGVRILALEDQLAIARVSARSAADQLDAALRAAGRGDIAGAEVDSRRQAALDSADKVQAAESALTAARGELNRQLGLPPEVRLRLAPPPPAAAPPPADALVRQALDRRLDLAALRAGYDSAEAELHKAILDQFPSLSLTMAYTRDTADNRTFGPQIGFTLPLWNRNRGGIAIARATREQLKSEYDARLFQTRADIDAAVSGIATVRAQREALLAALPRLEQYAAATERAARRGDLAPATAAAATQAVRDRRLTLLQLDQQVAEQMIALELLTGSLSEGWTK